MALRFSTGLRNFLNEGGSVKQALNNGKIYIYSGTQPALANDAASGTLLAIITKASGALTEEVQAVGTVSLTGGASGSVDTITVNGLAILPAAVTFNASLTQTAVDIVAAINNNPQNLLFVATSAVGVVTITAKPGLGALANGWVVASTATTITKTDANMAGGVTAINGLTFGDAASGTLVKNPLETWTGVGLGVGGTAGWFRFEGAVADTEAADTTDNLIRLDGNIATSGANLNMSSTTIATGATQTISTFSLTVPAA